MMTALSDQRFCQSSPFSISFPLLFLFGSPFLFAFGTFGTGDLSFSLMLPVIQA